MAKELGVVKRARNANIVLAYRLGATREQIGAAFGLTGGGVGSVLTVRGVDGDERRERCRGAKAASARAGADAESMERRGVTVEEWRGIPAALRSAFHTQKSSAKARGIDWQLTLGQWLRIWQESGYLDQRGRHADEYVMARHGDVGPYAHGNVTIKTASENLSERQWPARR
jgi:hypothetical protein